MEKIKKDLDTFKKKNAAL